MSVEPVSVDTSVQPVAVTLSFPAAAEFIRLARLVASGLLAQFDYGLDDVEDLRIAVDELCAVIVAHAEPAATLVIAFEVVDGHVRVEASAPARAGGAPILGGIAGGVDRGAEGAVDVDELSQAILLAAADDHEIARRDGAIVGRLRKRPVGADG